ncbi:MAG: endonuclease [Phycisphaerae bacterium]|nr:MAG: endonuclease [Phycisphaerae bacterium]
MVFQMSVSRLSWIQYSIFVAVVLAGLESAAGWGADGHRIVGDIAWHRLNPTASAEVERLLALDDEYNTLADACIWADVIRSDRSYRWASGLHYLNIPKSEGAYVEDRDCKPKTDCPANAKCPPRDCVVSAITFYLGVLRDSDANDREKLIALKFVGHFVGDVHQPLHAGYARDRGGNDVRVEFNHNNTNLHTVWDSMMIREMGRWTDLAESLNRDLNDSEVAKRVKAWSADLDPANWAVESNALVPQVYSLIPKSGHIGREYQDENTPLIRAQLQKAGIRLACVLNRALGHAAQGERAK